MRGRGQSIFKMVSAIINLLFIINKRDVVFLRASKLCLRLILLKLSSFLRLKYSENFHFLGN